MTDHATALIAAMGQRARAAATILASTPTATKAAALSAAAADLRARAGEILAANAGDVAAARENGLSAAMIDRLTLNPARLEGVAKALEDVAALPDPVGRVIDASDRPNGLKLARVRVPLGVVGIIFESRPNVTADAGALAMMAGNAAILRGGSEAQASNRAIHASLVTGLRAAGLPEEAIQLVPTTDRAAVGAMLKAEGLIDIMIPRGGKSLVARVQSEARVPVLAHLDGINHLYVDGAADPVMAAALAVNAKMRRTGVCGATETLLIDRAFGDPAPVLAALIDAGCELRGTAEVLAIDPRATAAGEADWDTEYLEAICAVALVDGVEGAMAHIARHGIASHRRDRHRRRGRGRTLPGAGRFGDRDVECLDPIRRRRWNSASAPRSASRPAGSTRAGRSRSKGLTTYKWQVRGTGQARP